MGVDVRYEEIATRARATEKDAGRGAKPERAVRCAHHRSDSSVFDGCKGGFFADRFAVGREDAISIRSDQQSIFTLVEQTEHFARACGGVGPRKSAAPAVDPIDAAAKDGEIRRAVKLRDCAYAAGRVRSARARFDSRERLLLQADGLARRDVETAR